MTTDITVKLLAKELEVSVDYLICQFSNIGINKTSVDFVTQQEKQILFMHINRNLKKMDVLNTLTWQRKIHSTLNIFNSSGKSKKVQIEVRKKHTYLKNDSQILKGQIFKKEDSHFSCLTRSDEIPSKCFSDDKIVQKKDLQHELSSVKLDSSCLHDKKRIVLLTTNTTNKKRLVENISHAKESSSYQCRKNKTIVCRTLRDQKHNSSVSEVSLVGLKEQSNISLDNRKKVGNDRRFRNRQRLRSSKLRYNTKVSAILKYRKNNGDPLFEIRDERDEYRPMLRSTRSKKRKLSLLTQHIFNKPTHVVSRDVIIGEMITVSELANKMSVKGSQVIKVMMRMGVMVTINQVVDQKTAKLVAEEMGHHVILRRENDIEDMIMNDRQIVDNGNSIPNIFENRPPIVTIMGHVDHGKTSLLDCIRSSKLVAEEIGGITQRIGAYCVEIPDRGMITFLDTPGHSAFVGMRTRGVRLTDIVVLVVAIDDGVMLQTIEAIQHAKSVNVPIIVALNKIDKGVDSVSLDRVKNGLAQHGIISEDWGGETQFVNVSAKLGIGIDELLNAILLESEILELKVVRTGIMASGIVIDSYLDKGRGPVAGVLIQEGTLKSGDVILCGLEYGRVRSMRNELGYNVDSAGPSMPVEVFGLSGPPFAGDSMIVVRDEKKAREVALYRKGKFRSTRLLKKKKDTLENAFDITSESKNVKSLDLNIVLKSDIQGSIEAISNVLKDLSNSSVTINIVGSGVGRITEADVSLAIVTRSILIGFNVRSDVSARRMIETENLKVYYYSIIYDLVDGIKRLANSILLPKFTKKNIALVEVRDVFVVPKLGNIAGCMVLEGMVQRHNKVRVLRKGVVVYEGELESLRRFKDDVNEVRSGMECGIGLKNCTDIRSGDLFEMFENVDIKNVSNISL